MANKLNQVLKLGILIFAATVIMAGSLPGHSARAADIPTTDFSFEQDLNGWMPVTDKDNGNDQDDRGSGFQVSSDSSTDGTHSVKMTDTKNSRAYGLESGKLSAAAGTTYIAYADVKSLSGESELHLRYYSDAGSLLDEAVAVAPVTGAWSPVQASMEAPAGTAYAAVLLYSDKINTGTAYWDRVRFTSSFTDLGVQVGGAAPLGSTFGNGANQDKIYSVVTGNANDLPVMQVIDADTESVATSVTLPADGARPTGVWATATATDGTVYLGAYTNGRMYKYVPGAAALTDLGQAIPGESYVYDLAAGRDGKVYGGTYNHAGFFQYDPASGFSQIGGMPVYAPPGRNISYTRALAYDAVHDVSYLAVGANASLVRYDHATGQMSDILPAAYSNITLAGAVEYEGDRVFVSIGGYIVVLRVDVQPDGSVKTTEEAAITGTTPRVSPARNGGVYLIQSGKLARYDIASATVTPIEETVPGRVQRFGWVTLEDQGDFPGETLVALCSTNNETYLMKYNPQNGAFRMARVEGSPRIPGAINSIGAGPDGSIYTSAYLTGGLGRYIPFAGDANDGQPEYVFAPINQIDKIESFNGKLYLGVYPGGQLYEYDPSQAWSPGTNPKLLIGTSGYDQDRPKAIAYGDNRVFMGTTGKTGALPGALSVYDYATGTTTVHKNIVTDQSIISLAYLDGTLYGGTTIRGGLESVPSQTEAKLFAYDPVAGVKTAEYSLPPTPSGKKLTAITELIPVDGKLWGFAEGYLFVFDPATAEFEYMEEKFADVTYPGGTYRDADLVSVAKDPENLYGTIGNKYLFKLNKASKEVTVLQSAGGADMLAADKDGNLYYRKDDTSLWRYSF
ncbi:hypothetical protein [Cohnella zeiphila]|uniref:CBM-cenC domain-containing protein n=1 Tax=Cohnella zeiphila TaxID=2761120 RepID=A0A7X0SUX9_9BACL|nr:hypothetical protein [Cohnella zeiphila]MBB6734328.1 hypothetical protein [Cohnella zeiphila]